MSNQFYNHNGYPGNSEDAQSVDVRAELKAVEEGFNLLPAMEGHEDALIVVNGAGSALIPIPIGKFKLGVNWTPVIHCVTEGNLVIVYSTQIGVIHRLGQFTLAQFELVTSTFTHTTASGSLWISGLPIISSNQAAFPGGFSFQGITKANYTQFAPTIGPSSNTITIDCCGSGQNRVGLEITDLPTTGTVRLMGSLLFYGQT